MFNRKAKKIRELQKRLRDQTDIAERLARHIDERAEVTLLMEARCEELRMDHVEDLKTIEDMRKERDHALALAVDNGKKLDELMNTTSKTKKEYAELHRQIEDAKRKTECPADCKNRKNSNACRTCTRYPHAKDKYEVAE